MINFNSFYISVILKHTNGIPNVILVESMVDLNHSKYKRKQRSSCFNDKSSYFNDISSYFNDISSYFNDISSYFNDISSYFNDKEVHWWEKNISATLTWYWCMKKKKKKKNFKLVYSCLLKTKFLIIMNFSYYRHSPKINFVYYTLLILQYCTRKHTIVCVIIKTNIKEVSLFLKLKSVCETKLEYLYCTKSVCM